MSDKLWETFLTIFGGAVTGAIGWFTGWSLNKRQRTDAKQDAIELKLEEFIALLAKVINEGKTAPHNEPNKMVEFYRSNLPEVFSLAFKIKNDFVGNERAHLMRLVSDACNLTLSEMYAGDQTDNLKKIQDLLEFVEKHKKTSS